MFRRYLMQWFGFGNTLADYFGTERNRKAFKGEGLGPKPKPKTPKTRKNLKK